MPANPTTASEESIPLLAPEPPRAKLSRQKRLQWTVLAAAAALCLSVDFGGFLSVAPQLRILEDIVCDNYYTSTGIQRPHDRSRACKIASVQAEVALINGWKDTFDVLPSVFFSIPYGALANRFGRKPMIMAAVFGAVLGDLWVRILFSFQNSIPARWIWASGIFRLIGGGEQVVALLAMLAITDIFPEKERASALFRLTAVSIFSEIVASPLSALLMAKDPWVPFSTGMALEIVGAIFTLFIPEILSFVHHTPHSATVNSPMVVDTGVTASMKRGLMEMYESLVFLSNSPNQRLLLFGFLASTLGQQTTYLIMQYTSIRLSWTYAQATILVSMRGVVALINALVLMPLLSNFLDNYCKVESISRNYRLTQWSALLLVFGFGLLFLAESSVSIIASTLLLSLGSAYPIALRSLGADLVSVEEVALFYSEVTTMESSSVVMSGPLLAGLFQLGVGIGGVWLGLPFLVAAIFAQVALATVSAVQPPSV